MAKFIVRFTKEDLLTMYITAKDEDSAMEKAQLAFDKIKDENSLIINAHEYEEGYWEITDCECEE